MPWPTEKKQAVCLLGDQDCPPVGHYGSRAISGLFVVINPAGSWAQDGTQLVRLGRGSPQQSPLLSRLLSCSKHFPQPLCFYLSSNITIPCHR